MHPPNGDDFEPRRSRLRAHHQPHRRSLDPSARQRQTCIAAAAARDRHRDDRVLRASLESLVVFWGSMLALTYVPTRASRNSQRSLVILAALLLAGAWGNRIAAVLLLPGTVFGLWMSNRGVSWKVRAGWVAVFAIVFAGLIWDWRRPMPVSEGGGGGGGTAFVDPGDETKGTTEAYKMNYLVGVSSPFIQLPVSAGRWVIEGLAAATEAPFESRSLALLLPARLFAIAIALLTCLGWFRLWRGGHWYALRMAAYFVPPWFLWGARIKPRYMMPIAPILLIQLWSGAAMVLFRIGRAKTPDAANHFRRIATLVGATLVSASMLLNFIPYGIDLYIRHQNRLNFYDIARRGAFAELVDIGAYLQTHAPPGTPVWINWTPNRRIIAFLTNCDVRTVATGKRHGTADLPISDPSKLHTLTAYFSQVPGDFAIVYYDQLGWPTYHLPFAKEGRGSTPRWWQLWQRDRAGHFRPVEVPIDRNRVRSIPGL